MKRFVILKMNKKVYGVEPYNRFALRDCFYSMVFPIVQFYGGSANTLAIATNNEFSFSFVDNRLKQKVSNKSEEHLNKYLLEQGIGFNKDQQYHDQIIETVCDLLDKGHLVIVSLSDAISYDPDTGERTGSHGGYGHWVLFHGYDKTTQVFFVIDHYNVKSPIYCNLHLDFVEFERSYLEHAKKFGSELQYYSKIGNSIAPDLLRDNYLEEWRVNRLAQKDRPIEDFLNYLEEFFQYDPQPFKRYRFFVAEDIGHLGVYYLQQLFVFNSMGLNRGELKLFDQQSALILKIKQEIVQFREAKSDAGFTENDTSFMFAKELISKGRELEGFIDHMVEKGELFWKNK